jgi:hypothetical protein
MIKDFSEVASLDNILKIALALIAVAVVSWVLVTHFQRANLDNDSAQHLSVAQNLLAGKGLSTSLLFYDEHFEQRRLPAAQTIWPPGYPLLLAALIWCGMSGVTAIVLIGSLTHVAACIVLFSLLRRLQIRPAIAFFAALVWAVWTTELGLLNRGYTEPAFILCTLLATYSQLRAQSAPDSKTHFRWLIGCGAWLGVSFLIRYIGIIAVAAGIAAVALATLINRRQLRPAIVDAGCVALVPTILIGAVFVRNWFITRTMTGWPEIYIERDVIGAIKALVWAIRYQLIGAPTVPDSFWSVGVVLIAGATAGAVWLALNMKDVRRIQWSIGAIPVALFSAIYILASVAFLVWLAAKRNAALLEWRYLVPLVPFALVLLAIFAEAISSTTRSSRARRIAWTLMSIWVCAVLIGQYLAVEIALDNKWLDRRAQSLQGSLGTQLGSADAITIGELLRKEASESSPILSNEGQGLGLMLERPTLTLSPRTFVNAIWDSVTVRELIDDYHVRWIAFFPALFDPADVENRNRPFFISLASGDAPPWLEQITKTEYLHLYRVRDESPTPDASAPR